MSIDKSLRQHYAMQGKVKNYLGKQKMVKAPKKWKSAPNHPETELAYITKAEKDALIKMNMYGSMNGKAHKGPSGIISLNGWGDAGRGTSDASHGGGNVSGGGDNRDYGGGRAAEERSARAAASQEAARVAAVQANEELTRQREMKELIAQQQEEKYDVPVDPTKFGETITKLDKVYSKPESEWTIEDKLAIEEEEKKQNWDKVKELSDRGHSSDDIQKAMDKGLLMKEDAIRRQGLIERGLAAIKPETKLESSLMGTLKKTFDPKSLATNFALRKMGLGWLNPVAGLASLFFPGKTAAAKEKIASYIPGRKPKDMSAFSDLGLYANRQPTSTNQFAKRVGEDLTKQIAGKENVIAKNMAKYTGGKSMMEDFYENEPSWSKRVGDQLGTTLQTVGMNQDQLDAINKLHKRNLAVDQSTTDFFAWHPQKKHVERFVKDIKEKDKTKLFSDTPKDIVYGDPTTGATTQEIQDYINSLKNKHGTIKNYAKDRLIGIADGGRIDKPLTGRSRDI